MRLWPRKRVYVDDLPRTHDVRFGLIFLVLIVAVFAGLYAVGYFVAGDKIPRGTTVAGVDIGGMTRSHAVIVLQDELAPRLQHPITATRGQHTFTAHPQRAGLVFDTDATLDEVMGGSNWDPRHMLKVLSGGEDVDPVVTTDRPELREAMKPVAAELKVDPASARVVWRHHHPKVVSGHQGRRLDLDRTSARLEAALVAGRHRVSLPTRPTDPSITATEARRFVHKVLEPAASAPVTVRAGNVNIRLKPKMFATALRGRPHDGALKLGVDAGALYAKARGELDSLPHHPTRARIVFRHGKPVVRPSRVGLEVTKSSLAKAVLDAASRHGKKRHADVRVTRAKPAFTTADARRLGIHQRLGQATAEVSTRVDRGALRLDVRQLNSTIIKPGATFSFLHRVTSVPHQRGASALASVTYNAGLHAGLAPKQVSPRRHYSSRFPQGRDARIDPPHHDLVLQNKSSHGVLIRAQVLKVKHGETRVHVEMWGSKEGTVSVTTTGRHRVVKPPVRREKAKHCRARSGTPGFDITMTQQVRRGGYVVHQAQRRTHYLPVTRVVCRQPHHKKPHGHGHR
ncbi:MAG: peptidoglycan binding domain-containing protein [Nocardioidaceae bacterium]